MLVDDGTIEFLKENNRFYSYKIKFWICAGLNKALN